MTKNEENTEQILDESINLPISRLLLSETPHNNSHYFLCPLFEVKAILKFKEYLNSYIEDGGRKSEIDSPLYCLFKFKNINDSEVVNKYFFSHPCFAFSYYAGKNGEDSLVMYVLKAKEDMKKDYAHIINGRYSFVSEEYKNKYKSFGFTYPIVKFIDDVVNKDEKHKTKMEGFLNIQIPDKSEVWNIFEPEREIFRYAA